MKITFSLSVSFPKMISSSLSLPPHHWGIPVMAFLRNSLRFHYFKIFIVWALWCRIVILIVDGVISFIYAPMNPIVAFLSFKRFPSCCLILVFIKKGCLNETESKIFPMSYILYEWLMIFFSFQVWFKSFCRFEICVTDKTLLLFRWQYYSEVFFSLIMIFLRFSFHEVYILYSIVYAV